MKNDRLDGRSFTYTGLWDEKSIMWSRTGSDGIIKNYGTKLQRLKNREKFI